VAASILAEEAKHDAWVGSAVLGGAAWDSAYQTPLGLSGVYSLAGGSLLQRTARTRFLMHLHLPAQFIIKCPDTNPALPVKVLPAFVLSVAAPAAGSSVSVKSDGIKADSKQYVAWFTGLQVLFSDIADGKTTVPAALANQGTVYAALTSSNAGAPTDAEMLSGLAVVPFSFSSKVTQV
jgi:hypothetical protein